MTTRSRTCALAGCIVACALSSSPSAHAALTAAEKDLQNEIARLDKDIVQMEKGIRDLEGKSAKAKQQCARLEKDLTREQAKKEKDPATEKRIADLTGQIEALKAEQSKYDADAGNSRNALADLQKRNGEAHKQAKMLATQRAAEEKTLQKARRQEAAGETQLVQAKTDEELRLDARLKVAGVRLPPDLELQYVWALPFNDQITRGAIWVEKDIVLALLSGNVLYCIRKRDGVPMWAIELSGRLQFTPTVSSKMVYVFVGNALLAIDRYAGQIVWRIYPEFAPAAQPCVSEPNLYIPGWDRRVHAVGVRAKEKVYVMGSSNEEALKTLEYDMRYSWHKTTHGHIVAPPALAEGFLYFGSEDGYVYAVSVDGEDRYKTQTQGPVRAPVTTKGTGLYVGSSDFNAYGLDRLTGQVRWIFPTGSDVLEPIYADPAAGVAIVASSENGIYGIDDRPGPTRGTQRWYLPDGEFIAGVSEKLIYLGLADRRLAAVEKSTGNVQWISLLDGISEVVPNRNDWMREDDSMRLLCISDVGYHLICLKERTEALRKAIGER